MSLGILRQLMFQTEGVVALQFVLSSLSSTIRQPLPTPSPIAPSCWSFPGNKDRHLLHLRASQQQCTLLFSTHPWLFKTQPLQMWPHVSNPDGAVPLGTLTRRAHLSLCFFKYFLFYKYVCLIWITTNWTYFSNDDTQSNISPQDTVSYSWTNYGNSGYDISSFIINPTNCAIFSLPLEHLIPLMIALTVAKNNIFFSRALHFHHQKRDVFISFSKSNYLLRGRKRSYSKTPQNVLSILRSGWRPPSQALRVSSQAMAGQCSRDTWVLFCFVLQLLGFYYHEF